MMSKFYKEKKSQIMMLGGRRSGKSTILASIVQNIRNLRRGDLFTIVDEFAITESGEEGVSLHKKRLEIQGFINRHKNDPNKNFVVDMSPTKGRTTYKIVTRVGGKYEAVFEFLDVPGEDMEERIKSENGVEGANDHFKYLKEKAKDTDVVIVAIDTPFLMEADDGVNDVYNRVTEIGKITREMVPKDEKDSRLIILCPVKCEKWIEEGSIEDVSKKVRLVYRDLINAHVQNPQFQIWIMPIVTAGGIQHFGLMPGYRYRKKKILCKKKEEGVGSIDEFTGQIYTKNGEILERDQVELDDNKPDDSTYVDYHYIPLSWYRLNGKGYRPSQCEQPAYHIMRFLAYKTKNAAPWYERLKNFFFGNLDKYIEVIKKMESENLLKYEGDGFLQVKDVVTGQINQEANFE